MPWFPPTDSENRQLSNPYVSVEKGQWGWAMMQGEKDKGRLERGKGRMPQSPVRI